MPNIKTFKPTLKTRVISYIRRKQSQFKAIVKRVRVALAVFKATKDGTRFFPVLDAVKPLYPNQVESTKFYQGLLGNAVASHEHYDPKRKTVTLTFEMEDE